MGAYNIPRAPVEIGKSGRLDTEDKYERRLSEYCDSIDEEARQEQESNPEFGRVQEYIDALEGRQYDRLRPRYRSSFVDNQLAKARKDARAQYTDIHPAIEVTANHESYQKQANILTKAILSEWTRHRFDLNLVSVIDHAMFGSGFWKLGAISATSGSPARLLLTPCGMDTVIPIKCPGHLQESAAVLYRCYKTLNYFYNLFGDRARGLEREAAELKAPYMSYPSRPDGISDFSWNSMSPAMRRWPRFRPNTDPSGSGSRSPFPLLQLREYWIEDYMTNESGQTVTMVNPYVPKLAHNYWYEVTPGRRLFPRKRMIVRAGNRIMYDGPSPYWHPFFPFEMLSLDPTVWAPGGLSKYRSLMPVNKFINSIGSGIEDFVKKSINPAVFCKRGMLSDADWDRFFPDMPGQKFRTNPTGQVGVDIKYMDPPVLPGWLMPCWQMLQTIFDKQAGTLDVNALARKKQIPAGDSIESMKELQGGHFRLEGGFIEAFLALSGVQAVSLILQHFDTNTRMHLYGPDGITMEDFDWDPGNMVPAGVQKESFWKMFQVVIAPHSLHGSSQDRNKQIAITLRRTRDISLKELHRRLEITNSDAIIAELAEEAKAAAQQGGAQPPAGRIPRMSTKQKKGSPI